MSLHDSSRRHLSTEDWLRAVFEEGRRRKNRDHTPRTLQPDGSQTTEDWLREVVFGTERPEFAPMPVARSDAQAGATPADSASSFVAPAFAYQPDPATTPEELYKPLPYGWGTTLFPGRDAHRRASGLLQNLATQGTSHDAAGRVAVPKTLLIADAGKTVSDAGETPDGTGNGLLQGVQRMGTAVLKTANGDKAGLTSPFGTAADGGMPGDTPGSFLAAAAKTDADIRRPSHGFISPPDIRKLPPNDPRLTAPWEGSMYSTAAEDAACERRLHALREHPERAHQELVGLSPRERFIMMANLRSMQTEQAAQDTPIMLALQGVPQNTQERAVRYNEMHAAAGDPEASGKVYVQFMGEAPEADLPEDMRAEAKALLRKGEKFADLNGEFWKKAYAQWLTAGADEAGKKWVVEQVFGTCAPVFYSGKTTLVFKPVKSPQVMFHDVEGPQDAIIINTSHPLFNAASPEDFAMFISAAPHEARHLHQQRELRLNRGWGKTGDSPGAKEKLVAIPSTQAVNQVGIIDPKSSTFGSIIQPLELEGHLLQKTIRAGILRHLGSSVTVR